MQLEGMPRAVLAVVLSWGVTLALWAGTFIGAAFAFSRGTVVAAGAVGVVMAVITNYFGWRFGPKQIEQHIAPGQGRTALLVITGSMMAFMFVVELIASVAVAFSR